jgi:Tol biopolymer transport system component
MAGGTATRVTSGMAFDSQPRFSPDGSRIVFISDRSGDDNLWTVKADGSDAKALTKGKNQTYMSPEWTLDPNYIVATRSSGQAGMQIWLYHIDGGSGVQLTGNAEDQRQLNPLGAAFGKDPRYIWFTERTAAGSVYNQMSFRWQLSVYDRKTGEVFRQSDELGSAMRPVLSPDGKWLVYATRHDAQTGFRVRNLETGDDQWLAYPVQRDDQESRASRDLMPGSAFTPDSSALITSFDGKIMRVAVPSGEITPIPFTAKVEQQLGPALEFDYPVADDGPVRAQQIRHPVLSPDGSKLAFTAFDRLYVTEYPDGTARRLTESSAGEHQPNWSPDSRHIVYVTWSDADAGHVRRVPAAGGTVETLTTVPSFYSDPIYTPDGSRIVVVRGPRVERMEDFSSSGTGGQGLDLMWMPAAGGELTRIAPHRGDAPHFGPENDRLYVWEGRNGLVSFRFDGTDRREHVKVTGYRAPGAQQAGQASAGRISPDGRSVLVEAERHLYVVSIPVIGGEAPTISVANPASASVPVRRLTRVGGEFGRWAAKGDRATWAIGHAFFDYDIPAARAAEEKDLIAKQAEGEEEEKPDREARAAAGEEKTEEQKKPTPPVYDAKETEITVTMPRSEADRKRRAARRADHHDEGRRGDRQGRHRRHRQPDRGGRSAGIRDGPGRRAGDRRGGQDDHAGARRRARAHPHGVRRAPDAGLGVPREPRLRRDDDAGSADGVHRRRDLSRHGRGGDDARPAHLSHGPRRVLARQRAEPRRSARRAAPLQQVLGHEDDQAVHGRQPPAAAVDRHGGARAAAHADARGRPRPQAQSHADHRRLRRPRALPAHRPALQGRRRTRRAVGHRLHADAAGALRRAVGRELLLRGRATSTPTRSCAASRRTPSSTRPCCGGRGSIRRSTRTRCTRRC